jgi:hypothetical protein
VSVSVGFGHLNIVTVDVNSSSGNLRKLQCSWHAVGFLPACIGCTCEKDVGMSKPDKLIQPVPKCSVLPREGKMLEELIVAGSPGDHNLILAMNLSDAR